MKNPNFAPRYGKEGVMQDKKKAVELLQQAHEAGVDEATLQLGTKYETGEGVKQDWKKAADLYQQAHKRELPEATLQLGVMYWKGEGVKQDIGLLA